MMAHESPIPVPHNNKNNVPRKPEKSKKAPDVRILPSGNPVNFGHGGSSGPSSGAKKGKKPAKKAAEDSVLSQSLPNGEKPRFSNDAKPRKKSPKDKEKGPSEKKGKRQLSPAAVKSEETYAGSSFHSSPAALNLPKPSFKSSPKTGPVTLPAGLGVPAGPGSGPSGPVGPVGPVSVPGSGPVSSGPMYPNMMPNQGMPVPSMGAVMPPGPPNMYAQPGFSYSVTPQGYINYQYPPYMPHQPPYPQMAPPQPQPIAAHPQESGHKITFNQLLGSQP